MLYASEVAKFACLCWWHGGRQSLIGRHEFVSRSERRKVVAKVEGPTISFETCKLSVVTSRSRNLNGRLTPSCFRFAPVVPLRNGLFERNKTTENGMQMVANGQKWCISPRILGQKPTMGKVNISLQRSHQELQDCNWKQVD